MSFEISNTFLHRLHVFRAKFSLVTPPCILSALMVATRTVACRLQSAFPALNIKEFFGPQIRAEARFRNDITTQFQGCPSCNQGIATMRNISKWPAMNEGRCALLTSALNLA